MKIINKKINDLWQSQIKDIGRKGLLWMALVYGILIVFYGILSRISAGSIDEFIFMYLTGAFGMLAFVSFVSYFYVYSKVRLPKWLVCIIKVGYKSLLLMCFMVCIPILIFLKITEIILNYRAKKLSNLQNWMIILVIDLFVMMLLGRFDFEVAETVTEWISCFAMEKYGVELSKYTIILFSILGLFKVEMDTVNVCILKIMNHYGMSKIRDKVTKMQNNKFDRAPSDVDLKNFFEDKNEEIEAYEKSQTEELEYDLEYQKKTIWKFQLICLIVLFLIASAAPDLMFENQSDAVNVITIFTLIMLFIDKRKEWR